MYNIRKWHLWHSIRSSGWSQTRNGRPLGGGGGGALPDPAYTKTISGISPLIAYTFQTGAYYSGPKYFVNIINTSIDNLYVYNYNSVVPYTTIGGYNALNLTNTSNTTGFFLSTQTQYKASIGSNLPTAGMYTTRVASISSITSYPGMTLCFWVYTNDVVGGIIALSEWGYSNTNLNRIYPSKWASNICFQYFSNFTNKPWTVSTWYFIVYTIPFSGGTGGFGATSISASSMNTLNTFTFNYTTDLSGNTTSNPEFYATLAAGYNDTGFNNGYFADYRVYGSVLSYNDLNGIFTSKPF